MVYERLSKQIIEFQKLTFTNCLDAVELLHNQATSVMSRTVQQNTWLPEEGQKMIQSWVDASRQERERFRAFVDDGFSHIETYFSVEEKPVRKTAKKAKAVKKKKVAQAKKQ